MKSIFIVTMGAKNTFTVITWAFNTLEDAEKMRNYLDKRKGASQTQSSISEHLVFDSFEEAIFGKQNETP